MKKSIAVMLTVALVVSLLVGFAIPSDWAQAEVEEARSKNLIVAEADQNYQLPISRALFCKLIVQMIEQSHGAPIAVVIENPFNDTTDQSIIKAYQVGVVKGISANQFAPNNLITRQEVAVMMMRAFRVLDAIKVKTYTKNVDVSGIVFADEASIASWAIDDVREAFKLGIVKGVGDNKIDPLGNTTIEQSILLSLRLYNRYLSNGGAPADTSMIETFTTLPLTNVEGATTTTTVGTVPGDTTLPTFETVPGASTLPSATFTPGSSIGTVDTTAGTAVTTVGTTTTTTTTATTETPATPGGGDGSANYLPVAKAENMSIVLVDGTSYKLYPSDVANDPDGDEMHFLSIEKTMKGNKFDLLPSLQTQINDDGTITIESNNHLNIGQSSPFILTVTDQGIGSTSGVKIKVEFKVVKKSEKPVIRFVPAVLNVAPGQTVTKSLFNYIDGDSSTKFVSIDPSQSSDFGQLTIVEKLRVGFKQYGLKFVANETMPATKRKLYNVEVVSGDKRVTLPLYVQYGMSTFKGGSSGGFVPLVPELTNPAITSVSLNIPSGLLDTTAPLMPTMETYTNPFLDEPNKPIPGMTSVDIPGF